MFNEYQNLINSEPGYEHYFIKYYLYMPYSKKQETDCIYKSIKILYNFLNVIESKKLNNNEIINSVNLHLDSYLNLIKSIKISKDSLKVIKDNNKNNTDIINYEEYKHINNNIYGDLIEDIEEVTINLHQRTNKTIKYIKNDYEIIHKFNEDSKINIINKITNELNNNNFFNLTETDQDAIDSIIKEYIRIKKLY